MSPNSEKHQRSTHSGKSIFVSYRLCVLSIKEDFCIEFIKMNKSEKKIYLAYSASSTDSRALIYICNPSCFELKNLFYLQRLIAAVAAYAATALSIQFPSMENMPFSIPYSLLLKSKGLTKTSQLDMFHVTKVFGMMIIPLIITHDIDRCT